MNKKCLFLFALATALACKHPQSTVAQKPIAVTNTLFGDTVIEMDKAIWYIFQDKNNNYWFGSDGAGVYRYNGKIITHFTTQHGLCDNRIRGIQTDKQGNLYFTTLGGISKFDGQSFTKLNPIQNSPFLKNEWTLNTDDLWFPAAQGDGGLYRYDGNYLYHLHLPKHYLHDDFYKQFPNCGYSPYDIYTIYKDPQGSVWFGTAVFGACRFDGKNVSWLYEKELTETPEGGSFGIRSILQDSKGYFWICNNRQRFQISPNDSISENQRFIQYKKENLPLHNLIYPTKNNFFYFLSIVEDKNGALWMATYNQGIFKYDGKKMTQYEVKDGDKNTTTFTIYKDNQGDLWVGTHSAGAYKFNGTTFEKFKF